MFYFGQVLLCMSYYVGLTVYDKDSELYNELLEIYFDKYNDLSDDKRKKIHHKYSPVKLMLDAHAHKNGIKKSQMIQK